MSKIFRCLFSVPHLHYIFFLFSLRRQNAPFYSPSAHARTHPLHIIYACVIGAFARVHTYSLQNYYIFLNYANLLPKKASQQPLLSFFYTFCPIPSIFLHELSNLFCSYFPSANAPSNGAFCRRREKRKKI